jgi:hypothetical protein
MVYDAVLKEKAKMLFLINGFNTKTIKSFLPEVSYRALSRWCKEGKWEEQRRQRIVRIAGRQEKIEQALDHAIDQLKGNIDPKIVFSVDKLAAVLKSTLTFEFTEELKQRTYVKKRGLTPETLKEIEEKILGL